MAVISIDETFDGRVASIRRDWTRTYTRRFRVITDDPQTEGIAVIEAAIGTIGNAYSAGGKSDLGAYCSQVTATDLGEDGKSWIVQADYEPFNPNVFPKDPTQWPIKVSWGTAQFERIADQTVDSPPKAVTNSAGDPYDPPVTRDDSRPVLTIVRNETSFDQGFASLYRDSINSDPFWGYDPYCAKCLTIEGDLDNNTDIGWYWIVTYKFEFNDDTWKRSILDAGFRQTNSGVTDVQAILDAKGLPIATPSLLDGHGKKLSLTGNPVFNTFRIYKEIAFDGLNLTPEMIPSG